MRTIADQGPYGGMEEPEALPSEAELDAQRIEYEGLASARDAAMGVMSAERSGNLSRMEASGARATRWLGAGSSLLSAGGRALSRTA